MTFAFVNSLLVYALTKNYSKSLRSGIVLTSFGLTLFVHLNPLINEAYNLSQEILPHLPEKK